MAPLQPIIGAVWQPCLGRGCRAAGLLIVGAALLAGLVDLTAFTSFTSNQHRLAGSYAEADKSQRGGVCRHAYAKYGPPAWTTHAYTGVPRSIYVPEAPDDSVLYPTEYEYGKDPNRREWTPIAQWRGQKSFHPNLPMQRDENRQWYVFDAEGKTLGRLAVIIAETLLGKGISPLFDPCYDVGAYAIVTNAEKVRVSGRKYHRKLYFRNWSRRPGHLRVEKFRDLQKRFPERIIMRTVWGMLPKTKQTRRIFRERLKVFFGPNHLYYHMNPVTYPGHLIKDCTPSSNMNPRFRIGYFLKTRIYKMREKLAEKKEQRDAYRLKRYRSFLKKHYRTEMEKGNNPEKADISIEEFGKAAVQARYAKMIEANKGKYIPRRQRYYYPGTFIEKRKIFKKIHKPELESVKISLRDTLVKPATNF